MNVRWGRPCPALLLRAWRRGEASGPEPRVVESAPARTGACPDPRSGWRQLQVIHQRPWSPASWRDVSRPARRKLAGYGVRGTSPDRDREVVSILRCHYRPAASVGSSVRNWRTSTGALQATAALRPHASASSRSAASSIQKPPTCSLASRYGPSVTITSPLGCARSDFALGAGCRPPAKTLTPAAPSRG